MKNVLKIVLVSIALFAGCSKEESNKDNTLPQQNTASISATESGKDSTLIRDANVNVSTLDVNKDGKVFQCPMDFEVISDHSASCPLCNMDLEEVSVADASKNLK